MNADRLDVEARTGRFDSCRAPAGWRVLVPGLPHWFWDQQDQALIFFGFHLTAMAIGLFSWGTWLSLLMLSFAFGSHAVSAADAIKQAAFPKFGPWVPLLAAILGLGAICYAPLMILGSTFAWPVVTEHRPDDGYWVNRWAYRGAAAPRHGETIWLRAIAKPRPRLARVLAGAGQKVRWSANQSQIDDRLSASLASHPTESGHEIELTVPARHSLVCFHTDPAETLSDCAAWEIVNHDEVDGRAWARSYPVWDRRLLR